MNKKRTSAANVVGGILFLLPIILILFAFFTVAAIAAFVALLGGTETVTSDGFVIIFGAAFAFIIGLSLAHLFIGFALLTKTNKPFASFGYYILTIFAAIGTLFLFTPLVDNPGMDFSLIAFITMGLVTVSFLMAGVMIFVLCLDGNSALAGLIRKIWFIPPVLILGQIILVLFTGIFYTVLAYTYYMITMFITLWWYVNPKGIFDEK